MFNGLKARRQLAVYVALGLSTGGGLLFSAPSAYAGEYTQESATFSGLSGTEKTGAMSGNKITLGKDGGPTDKPQNTYGAISAGGKKDTAEDVTGNTLIIHGLRSANGNGQSFIYGGVSDTGTVTGNHVFFNNGYSADAVIGGYSASLTKSVSNNTVEVKAGKIEEDIIGGWSDKAASTGAVSGNKVTITGGTLGSHSAGIIYGARVTGNGLVTNNSVEFSNATSKKAVYGAAGDDAASTAAIKENHVTINSGTLSSDVFGGYTTGKGAVTGNSVTIKGGSLGDEAAGGVIGNSSSSANASGNTLTISGGAFTKSGGTNVFGAYNAGSGKTINNIVNLGDGENAMATGFNLTRVRIYGGNKTNDVTGNTLNVNASGIVVRTAQNFEKYNFNLTKGVAAGSTMLKVTDSGGFGSTPNVQWSKITMNAEGWNADTTKYGRLGTMELLRTGSGADLKIFNTAALDRKATSGDFEYHMYTDVTTPPMSFFGYNMVNYVRADINRFQNADATADNVTGTAVYGGYSSLGNTTTNNKIKITNTDNTNLTVYGGYTAGAGDSTNNHVTITATGKVKAAYGGYATAANSKAEGNSVTVEQGGWVDNDSYAGQAKGTVNRNILTVKGHADWSVTGGKLDGSGTAEGNEVRVEGGLVKGYATGAVGGANSTVTGNKVTVTGGTVKKNISGGQSSGANGKATGNIVAITNGSTVEGIVTGGYMTGDGTASDNEITISGSSTLEKAVYGGYADTTGTVTGNIVNISDGTFQKRVYGGYSDKSGTVTGNKVTITGGTFQDHVYGGAGGDNGSAYTAQNFAANNNTVTIAGGTFSGNIYGGVSWKLNGTATGNTVNLGDDTHTDLSGTTLTNADIYGGKYIGNGTGTGNYVTGNTLNVRAKNITAKSANNFENYKFHLNDDIARNGGSMLTLTENNGFNGGNQFDWTKLDVDTSKLSGNTVIGNATLLTGTTNGLKFSNYAGKDRTHGVVNGDYETALRTDTNTGTATKVILDYNRFQNNTNATYDGSTPATTLPDGTTEVYGGISYAGNTTKNNHLTVTGVQGNLTSAYGGKTAGAKGDAVKNRVTVEQTNRGSNAGAISNVFGGYTSSTEATAKAEDNTVTIEDGTVGAVYGGYAENAASATGNHVFIQGGTVQNAVVGGGGKNTATGNMSGNDITITGGTVSGMIIGGDSRVLTSTSNKNIINLGDDTGAYAAHLSSAQIWGTSYGGNVLANDNAKIAGNTLNVKAKNGAEVAKVRNVQKFSFQLHDDTTKTAPLLNMTDADGFGKVSADNSDVKVAWANVTVDLSKVTTAADAAKIQGKNTYTLMRGANNKLKFSDYAARYGTYAGVYETGLRTDATANSGTVTATNVLYDINRFKDGRVTYTAASRGEALGGYSAFGNTTTGNQLTVSGVTGTLAAAYGAQTAGTVGGSVNNTVTLAGTGTGSVTNVYGGAITNAANGGNVTGNTVTLTGGKVTGKIYGGYTAGNGETRGNTVNLGAAPTTLRQGDASTLATGTNFTAAELYGGNKSDDVTGNTLNVTVKDAAAKKAQNFDKYTFYLTNSVAADKSSSGTVDDTYTTSRGTMLTLANGFDGQTADWNKVAVDTSKLSADKTLGAITLMKSTTANKLKFSNYAAKNHAVSGDYEVVQRTDTNTGEASSVLIDVNRFRNGAVVYDGVNPNAKTYAGVSYGGNTAEKNIMTLTGIASGNTVDYLSGGRSEGTAGGAVNNTVNLLGTGAGTLKSVYGGYIGKETNAADATGNTVNIAGGTAQNVYGGYTNGSGKTTGNTVNIGYTDEHGAFHAVADGTKVTGTIYGGSQSDHVTGNTLNVRGAITAGQIANFEKLNFAVNKDTAGKTLLSINGTAATTGLDWSKVTATVDPTNMTVSSYGASRITLMANANGIDFGATYHGAKGETRDVFEFVTDKDNNSVYTDTYRFKGNEVSYAASDNTHDSAWGGRSELGNVVEENTLTMTGGEITGTAYGGTSRTNTAKKNRLVLRGGSAGELVGGFGKTATDNTVDIFGGTVRGDVYGGHATNGAASNNTVNLYHGVTIGGVIHGGAGNTDSTNNTLAVRSFGTTAKDFDGVQNLHFYLPVGTTSSEPRTMLTLTNAPAVKDISTLNLGVAAVAADARAFRRGDAVSLLKVNGTLTTAAQLRNTGDAQTMKATQSGILDYTMRLEKRGENELIATVDRVDVNDRSKSPVETRVAASALLNAGADLLSNVGYTAAAEAAAVISAGTAPASSSAEGTRNTDAGLVAAGTAASAGANATAAVSGAFQPWAAQGGSSVRLNSGSYVDAKGWNLNVGFARTNEMKDAKLTYGPFVEYGRGTYDSYLDDGTHGSGAMHYVGGGVMAKMSQNSGLYVEGSLRAGRVSSDYTGSDDAAELSYDNASTYFAGHVGVGQEWKLAGGDKIEGYAKYFYSHQAGDTVKLRSGGTLEFGDVDSHRLRVGARYTHAVGGGSELYAGLAYEHEFGGDAAATYQGYSTPSPSLGGGTGILELGYRFAPKDGRVSYGVNLMGMTGQREGIAGGAQVTWAF